MLLVGLGLNVRLWGIMSDYQQALGVNHVAIRIDVNSRIAIKSLALSGGEPVGSAGAVSHKCIISVGFNISIDQSFPGDDMLVNIILNLLFSQPVVSVRIIIIIDSVVHRTWH